MTKKKEIEQIKEEVIIDNKEVEQDIVIEEVKNDLSIYEKEDIKLAEKALSKPNIYQGIITGVNFKEKLLYIKNENFNQRLKMEFDDYGNVSARIFRQNQLMANTINFTIKEIVNEKEVFVTAKLLANLELKKIKLKNPEKELDIKIIFFLPYGAFCQIVNQNIFGVLRNTDLMDKSYIRVSDIYSVGDIIKATLKPEEDVMDNRLYFLPVDKDFEIPRKYKDEDFIEGSVFIGEVKSVHPAGVFVNLDAGIDGLCSVPIFLEDEIRRGRKVCYQITRADKEEETGQLRIKGKIISVVEG